MPSDRVLQFYESESFAVIGVSRTRRNTARAIYDGLAATGKRVYAIGTQGGRFGGIDIYDSLKSLPERPQAIIVSARPGRTPALVDEVAASGAKFLWLQQGSFDKHVLALLSHQGIDPIKGCAIMYMPGQPFFHRIHREFTELLGGGYK